MPRWLSTWLNRNALKAWERDLDQRLAARRSMRPARQEAARKGWETRRAHG